MGPSTVMTSDGDGNAPAQGLPCLELMKREFRAAQQRRRDLAHRVGTRPDDTNDPSSTAGPVDEELTGVAAVRPVPNL